MAEAWQVRSIERQDMLESLKSKVMELEDVHGRQFDFVLVMILLDFMQDEVREGGDDFPEGRFLDETLESLQLFARAKEERDVILCSLISWLVGSITGRFQSDLSAAEMKDPHKLFHADSAMSDVEI